MEAYRIFYVSEAKVKPGKFKEAVKFWNEKLAPDLREDPWTKSLNSYAVQFGLGGEYTLQIWQEVASYSTFDDMDKAWLEDQDFSKRKLGVWEESQKYFDWGPSKIMGDWPESSVTPS
jgi:hypothetical protein